jgi:monoterpene epsilon-lactone hydrolase
MVEWETDERPMTLYTRAYVAGMRVRRDKQAFEGAQHTLQNARELQENGDSGPTRLTRVLTAVERSEVGGMPVWTSRPRLRGCVATVIYVHGGGYVHPLTADYWRLVRALTRSPAEVVVPAYPLAPDATVDEVLPLLLGLYAHIGQTHPDRPVVLMGDSAGGALVLTMARRLHELGQPAPAAVVALSPWLDATLGDPEVTDLEATDPMLAESGLRAAGRRWAGPHAPSDPVVSPANGSLAGLPPLHVYVGDKDILRPAVDSLAEQAAEDGAELHVHEVAAMFHVWMTRAVPEGRRTRRELARLVRGAWSAPGPIAGPGA